MPKGVEHNCHDFQDWLQAELDTIPVLPAGRECCSPPEPLAACPACERLQAASRRLKQGLRLLSPPPVPAGLLDRVLSEVLTDRRRRQRWRFRLAGALALAASVLVIALAGQFLPRPVSQAPRSADHTVVVRPAPPAVPSIRDTVTEAGSAVAGLTAWTVDQAVDRTRLLLPPMDDSLLPPMGLQQPLEPPARSLVEAGQEVSAGLEPITDSARRAIALFRRDLPPLGPEKKPEL